MKIRYLISLGAIILVFSMSACGSSSLKAAYFQPLPEQDQAEASSGEDPETNCSALNPHPLAESITEKFPISYQEVMTLYCDGYAFSDILLALETAELVDQSAEDLLSLLETRSWEEIWDALGIAPLQ